MKMKQNISKFRNFLFTFHILSPFLTGSLFSIFSFPSWRCAWRLGIDDGDNDANTRFDEDDEEHFLPRTSLSFSVLSLFFSGEIRRSENDEKVNLVDDDDDESDDGEWNGESERECGESDEIFFLIIFPLNFHFVLKNFSSRKKIFRLVIRTLNKSERGRVIVLLSRVRVKNVVDD